MASNDWNIFEDLDNSVGSLWQILSPFWIKLSYNPPKWVLKILQMLVTPATTTIEHSWQVSVDKSSCSRKSWLEKGLW